MAKNLLIVESPAKAKTIEKILGKNFEVKSCYGHIRDLEKDDMGIDLNNHYQPRYKVPDEKERVVKELRQLAKKADEVWLASDEDREGESISWHLAEVLGLDPTVTKRIVFHEITAPAIKKAVDNRRRMVARSKVVDDFVAKQQLEWEYQFNSSSSTYNAYRRFYRYTQGMYLYNLITVVEFDFSNYSLGGTNNIEVYTPVWLQ
jgi:DNA topoisomerase IA